MPIKHSALKQIRKDRKRQARNQAIRSTLKTITKRLIVALNAQKLDEAKGLLREVVQAYDHAAAKGILHRNTASRYTSRLAQRLNRSAK